MRLAPGLTALAAVALAASWASGCRQILGTDYALYCEEVEVCEECISCSFDEACTAASDRCIEEPDCDAYVQCVLAPGCEGDTCGEQCRLDHPAGVVHWDVLSACIEEVCLLQCEI